MLLGFLKFSGEVYICTPTASFSMRIEVSKILLSTHVRKLKFNLVTLQNKARLSIETWWSKSLSRFSMVSIDRFLNRNKHKLLALAALAALFVLVSFIFIFWWYIPQQEINSAVLTPKERLDSENAIRTTLTQTLTTLVQAVGGAAFIAGLFFT